MAEIPNDTIRKFLLEVMKIERRYGNELKNAKTNRRIDVREFVERFATKELEHED